MFDLIGHSVIKLRRSQIGSLRDDALKPKHWRKLSAEEVRNLVQKRAPNARRSRARVNE
jgi:16S rRNA U516 pseudouridylate synthase RsuA-like enzyme